LKLKMAFFRDCLTFCLTNCFFHFLLSLFNIFSCVFSLQCI